MRDTKQLAKFLTAAALAGILGFAASLALPAKSSAQTPQAEVLRRNLADAVVARKT